MLSVNISNIYLKSSEIEIEDEFDPVLGGKDIVGKWKIDGLAFAEQVATQKKSDGTESDERSFIVMINFVYYGFSRSDIPAADEAIKNSTELPRHKAKVAATFALKYICSSNHDPKDDEVVNFAKTNSLLHVWPYWREYIQSAILRMGLRPVTIPLFPKGLFNNLVIAPIGGDGTG